MPIIEAFFVEEAECTGPFGAKGLGEPAMLPTVTAVINAIDDAVGVRITLLPVTPEKTLQAFAGKKEAWERKKRLLISMMSATKHAR